MSNRFPTIEQAAIAGRAGRVLRELREHRGLDRAKAAEAAGLSKRRLAAIEGGTYNPAWTDVINLLAVLDVSLDDLAEAVRARAEQEGATGRRRGATHIAKGKSTSDRPEYTDGRS